MAAVITTNTLNVFRRDWAIADTVSADAPTPLFDHLRPVDNRGQRDIFVKSNGGLPAAQVVNEGTIAGVSMPHEHVQLTLSQKRRVIKYAHTIEARKYDVYGKVQEMGTEAVKSLRYRMEQDAADLLLNNAFTVNIATGQPLYANAHNIGPSVLDTLGVTAALSELSIEQMITQMFEQDDSNGEPMGYNGPWLLLVPPALELRAQKIFEGEYNIDSAERNPNVVGRRFKVVSVPRASSNTAYALVPQDKSKHFAFKTVTTTAENIVTPDEDGNIIMNKTALYAVGVQLPYNLCGNLGA